MFAIIAAIIFGLALLLDFAGVAETDAFNPQTLMMAGLLCVALHLAGVGVGARSWSWRRARR